MAGMSSVPSGEQGTTIAKGKIVTTTSTTTTEKSVMPVSAAKHFLDRKLRSISNSEEKDYDESHYGISANNSQKHSEIVNNFNNSINVTDVTKNSSNNESFDQLKIVKGQSCVPWWVFILSMTILSVIYLVALFGCVYMASRSSTTTQQSFTGPFHTPTRSFFPDQSSARKRTPPAYMKYAY